MKRGLLLIAVKVGHVLDGEARAVGEGRHETWRDLMMIDVVT
jgi:hypothetical protein